jgi:hypothetical protein
MSSENSPKTLRIEHLEPDLVEDLIREYPELKSYSRTEPSKTSVTDDPEAGLLDLVISLVPPILVCTAAVLNFIAARIPKK